ncbi:metal ABC transporter solute-binding protein, Zn/Mn family [Candidatus Latescibacterota bacterium]
MNKSTAFYFSICAIFWCSHGFAQLRVTVSIPPQEYFVRKIGGSLVDVSTMIPTGADPHTFEPKPRQLIDLKASRLYLAIGLGFEDIWLDRFTATNSRLIIIHTDDGIDKLTMGDHDEHEDGHNHHEHGGDPHIWLSPRLVMKQARVIRDALISHDSDNTDTYRSNYRIFIQELTTLDSEFKKLFESGRKLSFLVFHPTWGYFARDYGLEQVPVEIDGREPKPAELVSFITTAKKLGARAVLIQPQFSRRSAQIIADAIDGELVVADPLSGDWERNLRKVARSILDAAR